jgi:hypothetical protein
MFVYFGNSHTITLKGRFPKHVCCESCDHNYVYFMEREGSGQGFSILGLFGDSATQKAEERAINDLEDKAENELEVVPCPECGFLPEEMVIEARRLRLRWMHVTAIVLIPIFVIAGLMAFSTARSAQDRDVATICGIIALLSFLGSVGLFLGRYLSNQNYDPNDLDEEERIEWGQSLAISLEEYEEKLAEEEAKREAKAAKKKKKRLDADRDGPPGEGERHPRKLHE